MRFTFGYFAMVFTLAAHAAEPAPYCVGIRGNGELAPAHWAGLARVVEENGLPKGMAGSSSGSVTMFFVDSLAGNPLVAAEADPEKRRKMQALLLKSLPQFSATMAVSDKVASAWEFGKQLGQSKSPVKDAFKQLWKGDGPITGKDLEKLYGKYSVLANPELLRGLESKPLYFRKEAQQSLSVFGKFDAKGDEKLFFRPGAVDFRSFAVVLGDIADFYAGNTDDETKASLATWASDCADTAYGKQWQDSANDDCSKKFQKIVSDYFAKGNFQRKALFEPVGKNVPAYPSTALVRGEGLKNYNDAKSAYLNGEDRLYSAFAVDFDRDLSFGYWGEADKLAEVGKGLEKYTNEGDLKSKKFRSIGQGNWFEVLAVSPAEPGLANLQRMPKNTTRDLVLQEFQKPYSTRWDGLEYRKDVISAGGWSDLHPTLVLKAAGCENVVYLTRQDGDAVFGQQVFIRLTGLQGKIPFWGNIDDKNNTGWRVDGTPAADTPWNKIYNLGNPESSFNRSLREADAVYCTNWNRYNIFKEEMWPMVKQAYGAPVFLKNGAPQGLGVNPGDSFGDLARRYPGCAPVERASGAEAADEKGETSAQ